MKCGNLNNISDTRFYPILESGENMKYPMKLKTDTPMFNYIVRFNDNLDYYLFLEFDEALKKTQEMSSKCKVTLLYEIYFNTKTREFHGQNTFTCYDGIMEYDKHARPDLHIQFYVNAGEWLNPNEEWIDIINKKL